jgi:transketolase N-terminal domain/subunit
MPDTAKISLSATILPEGFRKELTGLSFSYTPDSTEGWLMKVINVTTSSADLLSTDAIVQSSGKASATAMATAATSDNVKFLFIKNTATTDGSTATNESVYMTFDGGTAAFDLAQGVEIPAGMSFYCKPMCTIANLHVVTGDANGDSGGEGVVQCLVAAIIDDA